MSEYDVVIVGARLAGAATALLLARSGLRVAALDRAHFPSDTLSSHHLQPAGAGLLASWGLLDRLVAAGVPATRRVRFDAGSVVLEGRLEGDGAAGALYSPPRIVLDSLLVDAAREAGAEVVEGFDAETVLGDGHTVTGIQGRERSPSGGRTSRTFRAPLVVGADGKNSWLAQMVAAAPIRSDPRPSAAAYTYWEGLDLDGGEMYGRPSRVIGAWPTKDGLTVTYVGMPSADFHRFRADPDAALLETFDEAGDLGKRVREATRVAPLRGTTNLPNQVLVSTGPGWLLAGDAGLVMDPGTGQGMGHALQDADALAAAIREYLGEGDRTRLARYQEERDRRRLPMYKFTLDLASYVPRPGADQLFAAIAASPEQTQAFFGVLTGTRSPDTFFALGNLCRLIGWRGLLAMTRRR